MTVTKPARPIALQSKPTGSVVLLSGGLDSTTLLYSVVNESAGAPVVALSFDYGQRHSKELDIAAALADGLGVEHHVVRLGVEDNDRMFPKPLGSLLGSALTDNAVNVPEGHYAAETMKATVVPNRNAIMLSIAYGVAVARQYEFVFTAVHAGDHAIYPDCRPEFIRALSNALVVGNTWEAGDGAPVIEAPFIDASKAEIAMAAFLLRVPIHRTWSCYVGGVNHCGRCGTCVERREAIEAAILLLGWDEPDPTTYVDRGYWKEVTEKAPH